MPPTIRKGRPEDAPAIAAFQIAMAKETEALDLEGPVTLRGVRAVFEAPSKGHYYVAEEGGRLVGCLLIIPEWSDWRCGTVWWIHSVYVVPEARGRGVYSAMYEEIKRQVETAPELRGLRLYVERRNTAAQNVYEKLGMTREHYYMYEWLK